MKNEDIIKVSHGGNVWAAVQKWGLSLDDILDFSANINPLGPSKASLEAIHNQVGLIVHYPEPLGLELKYALGKYLSVDIKNLVLGNGGSELIYLLGRMYGRERIIVVAPTFSGYGEGLESPHILKVPLVSEEQFQLPLQSIIDTLRPYDLLFLGNPNNPTGNLFPRQQLMELVGMAQKIGAMVVIDEAFIDFVGDATVSLRDIPASNSNLIVVGSATKFFAMPGLRLGYAIASMQNAFRMEQLLPPWRINTLASSAAIAAINDCEYIDQTLKVIKEEREYLEEGLKNIEGFKVFPSTVNFILVNSQAKGLSAAELQEKLGPKGILIRNCSNFANLSPYYFRVAVRKRSENQRLLAALREII